MTNKEKFKEVFGLESDTAKEMGMNVNENTPINFKFMVELIRRLKDGRQ